MSAESARMGAARVLHVVEPGSALSPTGSDAACLWAATLIAKTPWLHHDVLVLGNQRDEDHLLALGIDTTDRITPIRGRSADAVGRFVSRRPRTTATIAWSVRAMAACPAAIDTDVVDIDCGRVWKIGGEGVPAGGARHEDQAPGGPRGGGLVVGRAEGSEKPGTCAARVWPMPPRARSRASIRGALEIEDHELVVAVLSDRPEEADPRVLVWAVDMLRLIGLPATGLASNLARTMAPARSMMPKARKGVGLIEVDGPITPLMPGCDVFVVMGRDDAWAATLLARAALVQGSPVLALEEVARRAPGSITVEALTPSAIVDPIVPLWRAGFRPGDRPHRVKAESCAEEFGLPPRNAEANEPTGAMP